ncbi:phospholipase D1-like [Branchiostoma floridae]|uniref:Phospholipase n=1 Tax=Branchiostoma floridae TaxID=7739 RepID=A0A9J7KJW1_BRAFL|nr:phospholipase D1-like [Branchiostoma floridae]
MPRALMRADTISADPEEDFDVLDFPDHDVDSPLPTPDPTSIHVPTEVRRKKQEDTSPFRVPFSSIHKEPVPFNHPKRAGFIPGEPIDVKIIDVERSYRRKPLNPNLYTINLQHGEHNWTIKRRYKHFIQLHEAILLFKASLHVPVPTARQREKRKSVKGQPRKLPKLPKTPDALITGARLNRRMEQLEIYLQRLVNIRTFRNLEPTLKFLEVSHLSFVKNLGSKGKEGVIKKYPGGHKTFHGCCNPCGFSFAMLGSRNKRWFLVKDSFIAYVRPEDGRVADVLLFDQEFSVKSGREETGLRNGLVLSNFSRRLLVECWTARKLEEWKRGIELTVKRYGRDFTRWNRFNSFAPVRTDTQAQWFVDAASYMAAVAEGLEAAKEEIFIADWWFSPEIYLIRPVAAEGEKWRLDQVLKRKAEEGVNVFVLMYKEVELALGLNSLYSKTTLLNLHPNVKVLRHPDHMPGGIFLWAHHEKVVVVDQSIAFLGGIDLCYGRWDDYLHRLDDLGSARLEQQSKNTSLSQKQTDSGEQNGSLATQTPENQTRKPHISFIDSEEGPENPQINLITPNGGTGDLQMDRSAENVGFCNEDDVKVKLLTESPENNNDRSLNNEEVNGNETVNENTQENDKADGTTQEDESTREADNTPSPPAGQNARNVENASTKRKKHVGILKLPSVDQPSPQESLPVRLQHTNSYSAGMNKLPGMEGEAKLWVGKDYVNFIAKDFVELEKPFSDFIDRTTVPRMPWHDIGAMVYGKAARDVGRHFIQRWNAAKVEKAKTNPTYPMLLPRSYEEFYMPRVVHNTTRCDAQILRSSSKWSAGISVTEKSIYEAYLWSIQQAQHYIYIENQFFISCLQDNPYVHNEIVKALFDKIVECEKKGKNFRVYVVLPLLPGFPGEIGTATGLAIQAVFHWNFTTMCKGENSLLSRLSKEVRDPYSYVSFCGLRTHTELNGTPVSEMIYVHSKMMIVDDRISIIGSANINDRSMIGEKDSEMAVIVIDTQTKPSRMDGEEYQAGVFSSELRKRCFREHLGLMDGDQGIDLDDIVSAEFFKDVWVKRAAVNTKIYDDVFHCIPTDRATTFQSLNRYKQTDGLVVTDTAEARRELKRVQGNLVLQPLMFLNQEELSPALLSKEGMAPTELWT